MKQLQKGMTLIELVIVIIVLGILAAVAAPQFVDIKADAVSASVEGNLGAVMSAHTLAVADLKRLPTITELAAYVPNAVAVATGVDLVVDGVTYTNLTFTDTACATATIGVGDNVQCVKGHSP